MVFYLLFRGLNILENYFLEFPTESSRTFESFQFWWQEKPLNWQHCQQVDSSKQLYNVKHEMIWDFSRRYQATDVKTSSVFYFSVFALINYCEGIKWRHMPRPPFKSLKKTQNYSFFLPFSYNCFCLKFICWVVGSVIFFKFVI